MRLMLGVAVLMMLMPSFLSWAGILSRPLMVEGDTIQELACPVCHGTGPECKRCHGHGVIPFIVPGPRRPTQIIGHVYGPDEKPLADTPVKIELPPGDPISLRTDPNGRFGATLPPGNYTMHLGSAPPQTVHVEALKTPVPSDEQVTFPTEDRAYQI